MALVQGSAIEIPSSELSAHVCTHFWQIPSAPNKNSVDFSCVRLVIDHLAVHFHPGMGFEGHVLRTDNHLRRDAMLFQETCCGSGSLQTEHRLWVPDACHVNCGTDLPGCVWGGFAEPIRTLSNFLVKRRKAIAQQQEVEIDQFQIRFNDKKGHGADLRNHTDSCN